MKATETTCKIANCQVVSEYICSNEDEIFHGWADI